MGKTVNYLGAQIEVQREKRFADMFTLLMEVDYLKKNGFRGEVESLVSKMENHPHYDWERDYENLISQLEKRKGRKKYFRKKAVKYLFKNLEKVLLDAEIDYKKISDKLRLELPTPPIFYLEGPMGSGKSFIQRRLALSYMKLAKEFGIRGFDILAIRDPLNTDKPKIIKLLGGDGLRLTTYYDDLMRKRKAWKKFQNGALVTGIAAFPTYFAVRAFLALVKYPWGLGIGVNPFMDIGMWVKRNLDMIALGAGITFGAKYFSMKSEETAKRKTKRPEWLANASNLPPVYTGSVGKENLEGDYKENTDLAPQMWLRGSGLMTGDGKVVIIEQLPELTVDEQSWLSQLIQERELSIGNKGEHTIDMFPILYMGANPHLAKNIIPPLSDRLDLGDSCYVENELDKYLSNEKEFKGLAVKDIKRTVDRDKKTERELFAFLEYYRRLKDGKPLTKDALDALCEISTALAEDKEKFEISRRYLSIIDTAMNLAKQGEYAAKEGKNVTGENSVVAALRNAKSIVEQKLEVRVNKHVSKLTLNNEKTAVGTVKLLGYLTDGYMIEHNNEELKKEIEEEHGLGYVTEVRAIAENNMLPEEAGLKLIMPKKWEDKEGSRLIESYFQKRLSFMLKDYIKNSKITIDLSKVLEEDDTLLPAMYIAVRSALDQRPIKQDVAVAASCDLEGKLISTTKINRRLYTLKADISSAIVSSKDFNDRINKKLNTKYSLGVPVKAETNLDNLYGVLAK